MARRSITSAHSGRSQVHISLANKTDTVILQNGVKTVPGHMTAVLILKRAFISARLSVKAVGALHADVAEGSAGPSQVSGQRGHEKEITRCLVGKPVVDGDPGESDGPHSVGRKSPVDARRVGRVILGFGRDPRKFPGGTGRRLPVYLKMIRTQQRDCSRKS